MPGRGGNAVPEPILVHTLRPPGCAPPGNSCGSLSVRPAWTWTAPGPASPGSGPFGWRGTTGSGRTCPDFTRRKPLRSIIKSSTMNLSGGPGSGATTTPCSRSTRRAGLRNLSRRRSTPSWPFRRRGLKSPITAWRGFWPEVTEQRGFYLIQSKKSSYRCACR